MTNYIEEMMKTANVGKQLDICMSCIKEDICEYCNKKSLGVYVLPDFTAEKQLDIIKLITQNDDFTQELAQLTTELMNAGELDKQQVKEILE